MAGFIKFDGIDGEFQDKDHKNWSSLDTFHQNLHQPLRANNDKSTVGGTQRRRGDTVFEDVEIRKDLDKASPKIAEAVANGKVFPKVQIHITASYTDSGRVTYYAYELANVLVSSYDITGDAQHRPHEVISLNYEEIKVTYTECDNAGKKKGNVEFAWKVGLAQKG